MLIKGLASLKNGQRRVKPKKINWCSDCLNSFHLFSFSNYFIVQLNERGEEIKAYF